ncbi:MAG TPA: hypothetical protein VGG75_13890 [Trebonia sp.]
MNEAEDIGCKRCGHRGDLKWLVTHSDKPGQEHSPWRHALWSWLERKTGQRGAAA